MQMIQVEFGYDEAEHKHIWTRRKLVWIDASWNLKAGEHVTFKEDERRWQVIRVYETKLDSAHIETKWGLDLPKSQRTER